MELNLNMNIGVEKVIAPEILFDPKLAGLGDLSIQSSISKVINKIKEKKIKKKLLKNIVLSGGWKNLQFLHFFFWHNEKGTCKMIGFSERLKKELNEIFSNEKINLITVKDPEMLPIKGAKAIANNSK